MCVIHPPLPTLAVSVGWDLSGPSVFKIAQTLCAGRTLVSAHGSRSFVIPHNTPKFWHVRCEARSIRDFTLKPYGDLSPRIADTFTAEIV